MAAAMRVASGTTFDVVLSAPAGTGFVWEFIPAMTCDLKPVSPLSARVAGVPGGGPGSNGVRFTFTFSADFAGTTPLVFRLQRPWEREREPLMEHVVNVTVVPQLEQGGREVA